MSTRCFYAAARRGEVTAPIEIYFAGRATTRFNGVEAPLEALADEVAREFFRKNFHLLDPERHVRTQCLIRPGSADLVELFQRPVGGGVAFANDSSVGVGLAPLCAVERSVLNIDPRMRAAETRREHPAFGEDSNVLAVRRGEAVELTVASAFSAAMSSIWTIIWQRRGRLQRWSPPRPIQKVS